MGPLALSPGLHWGLLIHTRTQAHTHTGTHSHRHTFAHKQDVYMPHIFTVLCCAVSLFSYPTSTIVCVCVFIGLNELKAFVKLCLAMAVSSAFSTYTTPYFPPLSLY